MHIKAYNLLILFNEVKKIHLLIIKIKNIHELNVLRLIYEYFPLENIYPLFAYFTMLSPF